jgi:hypothetical protein
MGEVNGRWTHPLTKFTSGQVHQDERLSGPGEQKTHQGERLPGPGEQKTHMDKRSPSPGE